MAEPARPAAQAPSPDGSAATAPRSPELVSDPAAGIADPAHRALVGTAWHVGEHRLWFMDAERVRVQSPRLEPYAPGGLVTRYRLRDGSVIMNVMGNEIRMTWDGTQLMADGLPAERACSHP